MYVRVCVGGSGEEERVEEELYLAGGGGACRGGSRGGPRGWQVLGNGCPLGWAPLCSAKSFLPPALGINSSQEGESRKGVDKGMTATGGEQALA